MIIIRSDFYEYEALIWLCRDRLTVPHDGIVLLRPGRYAYCKGELGFLWVVNFESDLSCSREVALLVDDDSVVKLCPVGYKLMGINDIHAVVTIDNIDVFITRGN